MRCGPAISRATRTGRAGGPGGAASVQGQSRAGSPLSVGLPAQMGVTVQRDAGPPRVTPRPGRRPRGAEPPDPREDSSVGRLPRGPSPASSSAPSDRGPLARHRHVRGLSTGHSGQRKQRMSSRLNRRDGAEAAMPQTDPERTRSDGSVTAPRARRPADEIAPGGAGGSWVNPRGARGARRSAESPEAGSAGHLATHGACGAAASTGAARPSGPGAAEEPDRMRGQP